MATTSAAPVEANRDSTLKGIGLLVLGVSVFSVQDVIVKSLSGDYPVHELLLVRGWVGIWFVAALVYFDRGWEGFDPVRPVLVLGRGAVGFLSFTIYYLGLAVLPIAESVTLFYSAPLFVTVLAVPMLGERIGWHRVLAVLVGFAGVVVVMQPGAREFEPAMLLPVGCALMYAVTMLLTRRYAAEIPGSTAAFWMMIMFTVGAAFSGLLIGDGKFHGEGHASAQFLLRAWVWPTWPDLGLMALCGPIAALGFYCLTQAYRLAPAGTVTPFEYTGLPFAILYGYLLWSDVPSATTWAGLAMVVGAGLYIVYREVVRGRLEDRSAPRVTAGEVAGETLITFSVDEELHRRARARADALGVSLSTAMRDLLVAFARDESTVPRERVTAET